MRSCAFKAQVVGDDERELRPATDAPCSTSATPSATRWRPISATAHILHGEAVAVGIGLAFRLSARLGFCPRRRRSGWWRTWTRSACRPNSRI